MSKKMQYITGAYLIGYILSLFYSGVPSLIYLLPFKLLGIIFGITLGITTFGRKELEIGFIPTLIQTTKYTILTSVLFIITIEIKDALLSNGIDISFFTAPF